ncbi:protein canopy homolog 2 [Polyodon spathula]|uniref:protein canopy homolog 2 n=1 Tax=Polyodon spathula TaxID=7913 RepID=UPI001B7E43D6|nr:protein canopy homolog 2 [Polyodon spathula]XP_041097418.1 protein canopy homolog 2 [Polyodon spathula]
MKTCLIALGLCVAAALLLQSVKGRRGQDLHCGACRALVDEMEWEIAQIDPKKMIQTGSFRINPDGSQSVREVPFARSESSLLEVMERVCEKMTEYAEKPDPGSGRVAYERVVTRDGKMMDLSGGRLDTQAITSLKFTCEGIVEKYEDELIEFFSHETDNVKDKLCSKRTDLCDHALHVPHDEL